MIKLFRIFLYVLAAFVILFMLLFTFVYYNKAYILRSITEQLSKTLHAEVTVSDLHATVFDNFPRLSLTLVDAEVHDSLFTFYHTPFMRAERVFFQTDVLDLLRKKIKVNSFKLKNASVTVFKTTGGYSNDYIFKGIKKDTLPSDTSGNAAVDFDIKEIGLDRVKVAILDSIKARNVSFEFKDLKSHLSKTDSSININAAGNIFFAGLGFNMRKGSFIANKSAHINWNLEFNKTTRSLIIQPASLLEIDNSNFYLSGAIVFGKEQMLILNIKNEAVSYELATSVVTKKIAGKLARFKWDGSLETEVNIIARLDTTGIDPDIGIKAKPTGSGINLEYNSVGLDQTKFNGTFTNRLNKLMPAGDSNSQINFQNLELLAADLPVTGSLIVNQLDVPQLVLAISSSFNLNDEQDLVNPSTLAMNNGKLTFQLNYTGPVQAIFDKNTNKLFGQMNGSLNITEGELIYLPRNFKFSKLSTSCNFNESDLTLKSLNCNLNGSTIKATGFIDELIPFLMIPDAPTVAHLEMNCPLLDVDNLVQPQRQTKSQKKASKKAKQSIAKIIDDLVRYVNIDAKLTADKIKFQKFIGSKAKGLVTIDSKQIRMADFSINNSGGNYFLNAALTENDTQHPLLTVNAQVKNARVDEMMASCDNFGQEEVTDKNLIGLINANITYTCKLDVNLKLQPESMAGKLDASISNGQLNNLDALKDISKYVFKNRDFSNINFQEINSHAVLKGYDLEFSQMDIASSVMSMRVAGTYSFKKNTDMSIQVPLKNLQKKKGDYQMTIDELRSYNGANIFFRARTKDNGKIKITYDPLKKFRKEK